MDLPEDAMTDMACGHLTPQDAMAVEFLRERLGGYPSDDAAEQKLFLDHLREEWDVYQVEKQNARLAWKDILIVSGSNISLFPAYFFSHHVENYSVKM